jgi:hypothetical protein
MAKKFVNLKRIVDFFQGNKLLRLLVDGLPDDAVRSLSQLLTNIITLENVLINFLTHCQFEEGLLQVGSSHHSQTEIFFFEKNIMYDIWQSSTNKILPTR